MKQPLILLCLLLATIQAHADLVITLQTTEPRFAPQIITIKTRDDKYRTDVSEKISIISDLVNDDAILVNHQSKTYMKISGVHIQAQNAANSADPKNPAKSPQLIDTGKSEKIGGYTAEIYTASTTYATYTYWITKDYPDYAIISDALRKIQTRNALLNKVNTFAPDLSKLDGLVLKLEILSATGKSNTTTLLAAKVQPVAEDEFHVPDGYTQVSAPQPPPPVPAQNP